MRAESRTPITVNDARIAMRTAKVIGLLAYPFNQGSAIEGRKEPASRIRSENQRTGLEYSSEAGRLFNSGNIMRVADAKTARKKTKRRGQTLFQTDSCGFSRARLAVADS